MAQIETTAVTAESLQRPPAEDLPSLLVEVQFVHVSHRATRGCHQGKGRFQAR